MATQDPYEINISNVTNEAMMFRLSPADPSSPGSITISRDIFDKLLAIADAAKQASNPHPFGNSIQATRDGDSFTAVVDGGQFGQFQGVGRTLLEAIVLANRAYGSKLASYVD